MFYVSAARTSDASASSCSTMADDTDIGWTRQPDWGAFVLQQDFDNPEITFLYCVYTHKKVKLPPLPLGTPEYCLYECEDTHDTFLMIGDDSHWARSHIGHRLVKQTAGEDTETLWMQKCYPDRELKYSRWTCDDWNCQYTPGQMKLKIGNNQKEVLLDYYVWHQPKAASAVHVALQPWYKAAALAAGSDSTKWLHMRWGSWKKVRKRLGASTWSMLKAVESRRSCTGASNDPEECPRRRVLPWSTVSSIMFFFLLARWAFCENTQLGGLESAADKAVCGECWDAMEPNLHEALKLYRQEKCPIWMDGIKTTDPLLPEGNTRPISLPYHKKDGTVDVAELMSALRKQGRRSKETRECLMSFREPHTASSLTAKNLVRVLVNFKDAESYVYQFIHWMVRAWDQQIHLGKWLETPIVNTATCTVAVKKQPFQAFGHYRQMRDLTKYVMASKQLLWHSKAVALAADEGRVGGKGNLFGMFTTPHGHGCWAPPVVTRNATLLWLCNWLVFFSPSNSNE